MSSIRDQLLKAGLVTEEQVKQAEAKPNPAKKSPKSNNKNKSANSASNRDKRADKPKPAKPPREPSDLELFYKQRSATEKAEQAEQEQQRKEAARIRKLNRAKIGALLRENAQNDETADIRYNFVVGSSVKYLFVTEAQQALLSSGKLAITFLGDKRCLITPEVADQIQAIESSRLIIRFEPEN